MGTRGAGEHCNGRKVGSEKARQPRRGLGVAKLERMRMSNQTGLYQLPSFYSTLFVNHEEQDKQSGLAHVSSISPPSSSSSSARGYFIKNLEQDKQSDLAHVSSISPPSSSSSSARGYFIKNLIMMGEYEMTERSYYDSHSEAGRSFRWAHDSSLFQSKSSQSLETVAAQLQLPLEKKPRHRQALMMNLNDDLEDIHGIDLDLKLSL